MALRLPLRSLSRGIFTARSLKFAPVSAVNRSSYATLAEVKIAFSVWRYFIFESCENDLSQNHNVWTESVKLNLKMILWLCYDMRTCLRLNNLNVMNQSGCLQFKNCSASSFQSINYLLKVTVTLLTLI